MKKLYPLLISISILACNPSNTKIENNNTTNNPIEEQSISSTSKHADWNQFWMDFQNAVAKDDMDSLIEMTYFGGDINKESFKDNYSLYFIKELKEVIANTTSDAVKESGDPMHDFPNPKEIVWEDSSMVEGVEYESALYVYFGKVEENFKIVGFFAAG